MRAKKRTYRNLHLQRYLASISLPVVMLFSTSCTPTPTTPEPQKPRPMAVRTAGVRTGPLMETLRYIGTVHSQNEMKVLARVAGKIVRLPVGEGETAKRDAAVAYIAAPEMNSRVSRLDAEVSRVEEESAFLCRQSETDQTLLAASAISQVVGDTSRQKCESSKAALNAARAGLSEVKILAASTVERTPFRGKVLEWLAEPGENVMPGRPILLFGDDDLEVRVQVHEKDIASGIEKGAGVILFPDRADPIRTNLSFVAPMAMGAGRMVEVRIPLSKKDSPRFKHGMSVDVSFVVRETLDTVMVPENAMCKTKSGVGVYLVRKDTVRWTAVVPSIREKGWIGIEGEVTVGDQVVVGNLDGMEDGSTIFPVAIEGEAP